MVVWQGQRGKWIGLYVDDDMLNMQESRSKRSWYSFIWTCNISLWWKLTGQPQPITGSATKHDIEHSRWYNKVAKMFYQKQCGALICQTQLLSVISAANEISKTNNNRGRRLIIFGSPAAAHSLMSENLIDWLLVICLIPFCLGKAFHCSIHIKNTMKLKLAATNVFSSGVVCLHYEMDKQ